MLNTKSKRNQQKQIIAALTGKTPPASLELSPNDVLVQIALPLILILAIIVQLLTVAQSSTVQKKTTGEGPVLLDLWKQQLILRIERINAMWEKDSSINEFSNLSQVGWSKEWPKDEKFKKLCEKGLAFLGDPDFKVRIYKDALAYDAEQMETDPENVSLFQDLYDPNFISESGDKSEVPEEYHINDERRDYIYRYIEERCLKWQETLENLQWGVVEKIVTALPIDHELSNKNLAVQMENISQALEDLGYPLMPSVIQEYEKNE